ncbi:MAG TPA: glycoside hydrolase family 2 TIM barrel-domain containing protein, partial [bacterium]|nr:glycoside hydrolase family 2 TIM barrel-domain containing protein [bacterium]
MVTRRERKGRPGTWKVVLMALILIGFAAHATAAAPDVRIVADEAGQKLQVDGRDYMVFGMNWGYMPIGENYMYDLWSHSDGFIEGVLAREMPLLQEMGVNSIRQYVGIPPRWVAYIYENYGITTMLNHTVGRYGYTIDGAWVPTVDYSDPKFRQLVTEEIVGWVELYRDTPGVLFWLLGNENNYGLHWSSSEIEALPEGKRDDARARHLYSLFSDITDEIKQADPEKLVSIANGDLQYIDIIADECENLDILGTNVYRGISARDLFEEVEEKLGIPQVFTEFGADAYNAREMREDQLAQAKYHIGQWEEIYEQSYGKGRVGNAIGGYIFQWSDGWWKFGQESRLDIHDTNASWPNGGYS